MTTLNLKRLDSRLWLLGPWRDLALFVLTPLWIIPLMWIAKARFDVNSFGMAVLVLGGVGHHLPGFIRAYTDPVLFRRFRTRFILAPVFLIAVCVIFSVFHLQSLKLILLLWGAWHGAMQVNGFLRIYDAKAGSISPVTAWLDWAMCLFWFGGGMLHSSTRLIAVFSYFYNAGGPEIPPEAFILFRHAWDVFTVAITLAFGIHAWRQTRRGQAPSPVKFLLMASSFGFWWFAMVKVDNLLVGLVLFEIFHDVQYNTLVWIYNRRRVSQGMTASAVERFLFQPNAWRFGFYALLVLGYGALGMVTDYASVQAPNALQVGTAGTLHFWTGIFIVSALLHFYFDGFIWQVREKEFRQGLGLGKGGVASAQTSVSPDFLKGLASNWKWAFFIIPVAFLGVSELRGKAMPVADQFQNMARIIPESWQVNFALGLMERSNGDYAGAIEHCERAVAINPDFEAAHAMVGDIYFHLGNQEQALDHYAKAVSLDSTDYETQDHMGTLLLTQGRVIEAIPHLQVAATYQPNDTNLASLLKAALMRR